MTVGLSVPVVRGFIRLQGRVWRELRTITQESADSDGLRAVEAWLAIIDGRDYAQSWETAATSFQHGISKASWVGQMDKVRRPLGQVLSRNLSSTKFKAGWTRFGADFVFATSFEGLPTATETVTFTRQKPSGEWKAESYHIEPASGGEREETQPGKPGMPLRAIIPSIAKRLLFICLTAAVVQEAFNRLTLHWRESEQETWLLPFLALSIAVALWAAKPVLRRPGSWRDSLFPWLGTSGLLWCSLWAFALFYMSYLGPNLGLYSEPDWMIQNAGEAATARDASRAPSRSSAPSDWQAWSEAD